MSKSKYETTSALLQALSSKPELKVSCDRFLTRWTHWTERFGVYDHINKKRYIGFFAWQQDKKLMIQEEKLNDVLLALHEFSLLNDAQIPNQEEIQHTLLTLADIALTKLEIRQSRKLKKIQGLSRDHLKEDIDALREKRKHTTNEIQEKQYSKELSGNPALPITTQLFRYHEEKFHFGTFIKKSENTVTGAKVTKFGNFGFYFVNYFPTFFNPLSQPLVPIGQSLATFFNSIPIAANIIAAIPILFTAAKSWYQHKSTTKKIIHTIAAVLAILGIIAGAVFLGVGMLAAGGIVAAGLAIVGFVALSFIPWVRAFNKFSSLVDDIFFVKKRINYLSHHNHHLSSLAESEKDILLKRIEEAWLNNEFHIKSQMDSSLVENAKNLIVYGGDIHSLRANALIRMIAEGKTPPTLEAFLLDENMKKLKYLKEYASELRSIEEEKATSMATGFIAVLGAVLICVPTPATIIIGAGFLVISTLIGFGIKYKWGEKISNLFHKKIDAEPDVQTDYHSDFNLLKQLGKSNDETLGPVNLAKSSLTPADAPTDTESKSNTKEVGEDNLLKDKNQQGKAPKF